MEALFKVAAGPKAYCKLDLDMYRVPKIYEEHH